MTAGDRRRSVPRPRGSARTATGGEVHRSLAWQQAIFEGSRDAVFITDAESKFVAVNAAACELTGYSRAELLRMRIPDLHDDVDLDAYRRFHDVIMAGNEAVSEAPIRRKDGSKVPTEFNNRRFEVDGVFYMHTTARNIAERQRAKQVELERAQYYRALFEDNPIPMLAYEPGTLRILQVNAAAIRRYGYGREEFLSMTVPDLHPPDERERALAIAGTVMPTPFHVGLMRHVRKDGALIQVDIHRQEIVTDAGILRLAVLNDVTERLQAEDGLREREALWLRIFDLSNDGILIVGLDGRILKANQTMALRLGYEPDELARMAVAEIDAPDAAAQVSERVSMVRERGSAIFETTQRRRDGTLIPTEVSASLFEYHGAQAILGLCRDLTERRLAEASLRASERRYRDLFEHSLAGVYRSTLQGQILDANHAMARLLGFDSVVEMLATPAFELYPSPEARQEFVDRIITFRLLPNHEQELRKRDGTPIWVMESAMLVPDEHGDLTVLEGTMVDITDRKRLEQSMRLAVAAMEQAGESIVITDTQGTIEYVNPSFTRITGYDRAGVLGQNPRILGSGRQPKAYYGEMWDALGRGEVWHGHFTNRRKDGTLFEEDVTISPIRDERGEIAHYVAVKRDVTTERALEERLRQSQKMEAVGRLAGGVAHDFNNLLQALLNLSHILPSQLDDPQRREALLDELRGHVKLGASLTRQLLLFARREAAVKEIVDLSVVVKEASRMFRRLVRENIAMDFVFADEPVLVLADSRQLEQVLLNLVINAADAMPEGGSLALRVRGDGTMAVLEVADSGTGIPEEIVPRIFEPFFSTKEAHHGTGLGLAVVQGIVSGHGGRIEVQSEPGRGTTFRITLPRREPASPVAPAVASTKAAGPLGSGARVLVIEDEVAARESLLEILTMLGYDAVGVGTAREAGTLPYESAFDVLLTDQVLPDALGSDVANSLHERWPALRIILMSGYAEDDVVRGRIAHGDIRFLQKPFDIETLARELSHALEGRGTLAGDDM